MGRSLDQILAEVRDGDIVNVAMVSNEDDGIASYAVGGLMFHQQTGGIIVGGPPLRPARLESSEPFQMLFSDRVAPPPEGNLPGGGLKQPFNARAPEKASMSISLDPAAHVMQLSLFGSKTMVRLTSMGDLLVGLGPSLGPSSAGVWVVAFLGILRPPH